MSERIGERENWRARELASGMRQLAGTKRDVPEGSRHSARRSHFWPRAVERARFSKGGHTDRD